MRTSTPDWSRKVNPLPREINSLTRWSTDAPVGTLLVLGTNGGMSVAPDTRFQLVFGRCEPDVHVCVGATDQYVSRQQGSIVRKQSRWVLSNIGRRPIRLPHSQRLLIGGDTAELPGGYTPLFVVSPGKEHLLEVRVVDRPAGGGAVSPPGQPTWDGEIWPLSALEKLVLVCLARQYLRGDALPQPLTWKQVAAELTALRPEERWSDKRAAHIVAGVRKRLSPAVSGIMETDIPPPAGHMINHNLIVELLVTTTLVREDLNNLLG
ncbi:hypothetical protein [Parafrankia sp. FMc2]|uniref:hypothetical protein n=1 Tax=Parafrankia sp. FMc2 TaxID=3233196 RepID=UPI0034D61A50